jgi:hypothetical protein
VRHLDVHDDQVGREGAGAVDRLAAVAHRLGLIAMGAQQVAEQLQIEFVVLDNEDFLSHRRTCRRCGATTQTRPIRRRWRWRRSAGR